MDNKSRSRTPRLSEESRSYIDKNLEAHFYYGIIETWTQVVSGNYLEYSDMFEMEGLSVVLTPTEFFSQGDANTSGFRGKILKGDHRFSDHHIIASPGLPAIEFDFGITPCPKWRVWISKQVLPIPSLSFRQLVGVDLISGYARICDPTLK